MTGTAETEAEEFKHIYNLETLVIPPHRQISRVDLMDKIYRTSDERYKAVINDILDRNKKLQPILIGTTSIESSEFISKILNKHKLKHQVLNAKQHEKEAHIIEQAGKPGMITIATNMAGRGTGCRDENRRGKDFSGDLASLLKCSFRKWCTCYNSQRLSG